MNSRTSTAMMEVEVEVRILSFVFVKLCSRKEKKVRSYTNRKCANN